MSKFKFLRDNYLISLIIVFGGVLRFFKLNWGQGYFFHPDEYHIAISVNQLSFPNNMNPHFFSYGTFLIYLNYFTKILFNLENPFLIGRFYSAFFSTLSIFVVYLIGKKIFKGSTIIALIAASLTALLPGNIQQAHYATPEALLSFFILAALYNGLRYIEKGNLNYLVWTSVLLGITLSIKVSSIVLLPLLFILPFISLMKVQKGKANFINFISQLVLISFTSMFIMSLVFVLLSPFVILDYNHFKSALLYERSVADGSYPAFYTRQFVNTTPFVFQLTKIFPHTLGFSVLGFSIIGFITITKEVIKGVFSKRSNDEALILLTFLLLFIPNCLLFAKWTRFVNPTFNFLALFATYFIYKLVLSSNFKKILYTFLTFSTLVWGVMYFSIYTRDDIRITSNTWINNNLNKESLVLTEQGNTIEVPLSGNIRKIAFDFYNLENNPRASLELLENVYSADYFIVQSRRVYTNQGSMVNDFPKTSKFYESLFNGSLGFKKIQEFTSYPGFTIGNWSLVVPDESSEETWSVFDHPVIRIYQKIEQKNKEEYAQILNI